ncbi:hypothetical protein P9209_00605 [Prescottella defluvii]|nr:hypothetical protein P9209_00605 [Prescottella defluvii]
MTVDAGNSADWRSLLERLDERKAAARDMGGAEKVARYRAPGRMDVRARVAELLDPGRSSNRDRSQAIRRCPPTRSSPDPGRSTDAR